MLTKEISATLDGMKRDEKTELPDRIILRYEGQRPGPLLVIFGAVHGNEPAGVEALKEVQEMLDREPEVNQDFAFCGQVYGLIGNRRAFAQKKRFLDTDLNRSWTLQQSEQIKKSDRSMWTHEQHEMYEITQILHELIAKHRPERLYILDIHTTSAAGGLFTIVSDDEESRRIGLGLHAPVILGMLEGIHGTLMHRFHISYMGMPTMAITFEAGQHHEPLSKSRAVSAIINFMRATSSVYPHDVESRHDELLIRETESMPKMAKLLYTHGIKPEDEFRMQPGYSNFQPVRQGEVLAQDRHGPVTASQDGLILMPLYQRQGDDGFFLIEKLQKD